VPALLHGFVDDAAIFPPGSAPLADAVVEHRGHRAAWYADMVGPLLVPLSSLRVLDRFLEPDERLTVGIIGDSGVGGLVNALTGANLEAIDRRIKIRQVEVAVAKRSEDPQPGLAQLLEFVGDRLGETAAYAEIPLTFGLLSALDTVAEARARGVDISAKFRTGGLAAELFPTPIELAAVICACRDRQLPFKLTAGLHHAIRHADPETGFVHHGFLGVLAGTLSAVFDEAEVADVAEMLASTDPIPVVETVRRHLSEPRPLWDGFGTCSIPEPLTDLDRLGLFRSYDATESAA
jgi:hypothetical protein